MDIRVATCIKIGKIVINKGSLDGINEQMEFLVYDEGEEIFDPVTKKSLGILENPKGKFKVLSIQDKMSILISNSLKSANSFLPISLTLQDDDDSNALRSIAPGDKVKIINKISNSTGFKNRL